MPVKESGLADPISYLFEATKVMVPVITGFLVLFGGSIARVWERSPLREWDPLQRRSAMFAVLLGLVSLGLWTGTMAFCIRASAGTNASDLQVFGPFDPALNLRLGRYCAAVGHLSFFAAVVAACGFYWKTANGSR